MKSLTVWTHGIIVNVQYFSKGLAQSSVCILMDIAGNTLPLLAKPQLKVQCINLRYSLCVRVLLYIYFLNKKLGFRYTGWVRSFVQGH